VTLPEIAIKRPVATIMLLVSMVVFGAIATLKLPLAFMPEMQEPQLFIHVPYPGATPEQVERTIVRPIEDAVGSVKGLRFMWSSCEADLGTVGLNFDWATDTDMARIEVRERIDRIRRDLPAEIDDISVSSSWDAREADETVLEGRIASNRDLSESYDLLERKIVAPLERIPGVSSVRVDGVNPQEVRIDLRLADLQAHRLDVTELVRILNGANFDQSLGVIREPEQRYNLRTVATFRDVKEIEELPIGPNGLRLRDVANVVVEEPKLEYGRHLDGQFAVGLSVNKEAGANSVEICDEVRRRVAAMGKDPDLEGINLLIWEDQGAEIKKTLLDLLQTGVLGAILAVVVLYVFLRQFGATAVAVSCIPFSLITTCGVIYAQGRTLNTITLLGLIVGIGMLVDNAVVVMENIFRRQEKGEDARTASRLGAREISTAVMAATLTSVIVFLPMIFNEPSEMNIILRELGTTIVCTLIASFLISQTLIPLATSHLLRPHSRPRERWMLAIERRYERVLGLLLRRRWLASALGLIVTATGVYPFIKIDKNFDVNETDMFIQVVYQFSEEQSLERKEAHVNHLETTLAPHVDEMNVEHIYSFWSDGFAMTRLYMKEGFATEVEMNKSKAKLRGLLPEIAGVKLEIFENNRRFWDMDQGKRIAFQVTGEDSEVLAALAEEAKAKIAAIPGMFDAFSSSQGGSQEVHVTVNRDLARAYGVPLDAPARAVDLTFRGRRLRRFRTADSEREMRLTLDEQDHESLGQLRNLPLQVGDGKTIPLATVADFVVVPGAERIQRNQRVTNVWVGARFDKGTREEYMPLVTQVAESIEFPYGYGYSFANSNERRQDQQSEAMVNLSLSLLLVFAVMASLFESARQAAALLVSLPFAVAGAAWTLYLTGTDFDQPAFIGLLLLIGLVVNQGILMLDHTNGYRREGMPRDRAMMLGGKERLRPILMTTATTLLGLVPIVVQKPALAGVYYYSMALVIMGGLAASTVLTAVLLPVTASQSEDMFAFLGSAPRRAARWLAARARRVAARGAAASEERAPQA
jgi:HAE1 family hydrophobic/amphiphilic exporter-1